MKKIFKYFALYIPKLKEPKIEYPDYKYQKKVSKEHLVYLKELLEFQRDRQSTIESKTSQLVGQSSIVFSLVALFIPLFYEKFIDNTIGESLFLITLFLIAFVFYLFTIIHSTRTLSIHKYKYSTGDTKTVLNKNSSNEFIEEQVSDLIFSINLNSYSNDQKGTNLILAHRAFTFGNGVFAILAFSICIILFLSRNEQTIEEKQLSISKEIKEIHLKILQELESRPCVNDSTSLKLEVDSTTHR